MPAGDDTHRQLAQQGRLWLLSLICATTGAIVVWRTNHLPTGILAFLIAAAVLGLILWVYEKRHRK